MALYGIFINFFENPLCKLTGTHEMQKFSNVEEVVNALRPVNPVYCIRPNSIKKAVNFLKIIF